MVYIACDGIGYGLFVSTVLVIVMIILVGCSMTPKEEQSPTEDRSLGGATNNSAPKRTVQPSTVSDLPEGALLCPVEVPTQDGSAPTLEYMPVLASDGNTYYNWRDACSNPAVTWYYRFDHPKSLAAREKLSKELGRRD